MFTARTDWKTRHSALFEAVESFRADGNPILDLTCSNPTECGFQGLSAELLAPLAGVDALRYKPDPHGLPATRAAIAARYGERGAALDPGRILLASGTSEAYGFLLRLLAEPGDNVLVPRPSYPLLDLLAALNDAELRTYPLHYDGRWWLDADALREAADDRTRAIVAISPNNPTGSFVKRAEWEALVELAAARGAALIVDEVFADYALADDAQRAPCAAGETRVLTFTLNGISKMLGLPQMKLAWIAVSGPAEQADEACRRLAIVADTYLSVSTPTQLAAVKWLPRRETIQGEILARVRANLAALDALRHADVLTFEGGWSAVLRVPRTDGDEAFALGLLREHGVLVDPGTLFGFEREGCVVVSLIVPEESFREGARRLDSFACAEPDHYRANGER